MTTSTTTLNEYLRVKRKDVDAALESMLTKSPACPDLIAEAMRYSLFAGGKRFRPILTLAAAEAISRTNGDDINELAYPPACAIEMIHTYSLIHDDLPAMDNDTVRRGRPTAHVVYGEGIAILAGDSLLTEAFRILARWPESNDPQIIARKQLATERIAKAAGCSGMVGGQVIDLQASGQTLQPEQTKEIQQPVLDAGLIRTMHEYKTGALIRAAAVTGAIMVGGSKSEIVAVDEYAAHLGLGFQIIDDILDVEGVSETLGKTIGKDEAAGKPTYPSMFGLKKSRQLATQEINEAKKTLLRAGLSGRLNALAEWVIARKN
jgi:geranylgeranyl diphosphate synthase type II